MNDPAPPHDARASAAAPARDGAAPTSHVVVLEKGERRVHLVGTAHISRHSVEEVERLIAGLQPDTVCVELCALRHASLGLAEEGEAAGAYTAAAVPRGLDVGGVLLRGEAPYVLASLLLQGYQRRLGRKLGVRPGAELIAAVRKAREVGAELVLADRDIRATLRRVWHNLPLRSRVMVVLGLAATLVDKQDVSEEQVEALKDRKQVTDVMAELGRVIPGLKRPLIDERDLYLISAIEDAPGKTVVAVVGAGHVAGMLAAQGLRTDREALSAIPPRRLIVELRRWLVPAVAIAAIVFGLVRAVDPAALAVAWLLPTTVATALLALFARAHIVSFFAAVALAPLAALVPVLDAAAWVGWLQTRVRPARERDRKDLGEDATSFRGLRRNRLSHALLVAVLSRGSYRLGAFAGAIACWIATA